MLAIVWKVLWETLAFRRLICVSRLLRLHEFQAGNWYRVVQYVRVIVEISDSYHCLFFGHSDKYRRNQRRIFCVRSWYCHNGTVPGGARCIHRQLLGSSHSASVEQRSSAMYLLLQLDSMYLYLQFRSTYLVISGTWINLLLTIRVNGYFSENISLMSTVSILGSFKLFRGNSVQ